MGVEILDLLAKDGGRSLLGFDPHARPYVPSARATDEDVVDALQYTLAIFTVGLLEFSDVLAMKERTTVYMAMVKEPGKQPCFRGEASALDPRGLWIRRVPKVVSPPDLLGVKGILWFVKHEARVMCVSQHHHRL